VCGKWWANIFPDICLLYAQRQSFPRSNLHRMYGVLTHVMASWAQNSGLCVANSVHPQGRASNLTYYVRSPTTVVHFSRNRLKGGSSTHLTNFDHERTIRIKKIQAIMVRSGQETVRWLQSYALRGKFSHICLRKLRPNKSGLANVCTPFMPASVFMTAVTDIKILGTRENWWMGHLKYSCT